MEKDLFASAALASYAAGTVEASEYETTLGDASFGRDFLLTEDEIEDKGMMGARIRDDVRLAASKS